jgi:dipeptidyl aminopeptidase/acylaminoacyl peptidase
MHGDRDFLVPFNQSVLLYEKLRKLGKDVEFYKLHDGAIVLWALTARKLMI